MKFEVIFDETKISNNEVHEALREIKGFCFSETIKGVN